MSREAETIHSVVGKALDTLLSCKGSVHGISADSAFALGEAAGQLAKVRALLGRDIDQAALAAVIAPRRRRSRAKPESNTAAAPQDLLRQ